MSVWMVFVCVLFCCLFFSSAWCTLRQRLFQSRMPRQWFAFPGGCTGLDVGMGMGMGMANGVRDGWKWKWNLIFKISSSPFGDLFKWRLALTTGVWNLHQAGTCSVEFCVLFYCLFPSLPLIENYFYFVLSAGAFYSIFPLYPSPSGPQMLCIIKHHVSHAAAPNTQTTREKHGIGSASAHTGSPGKPPDIGAADIVKP